MRIGVEGRTLQGRRYGVARYLVNLLRNLVEIDDQNEYIVYVREEIEPLGFESERLRVKLLRGVGPSLAWRHLQLPLQMRKDRIDLHFSPSYFIPMIEVCPSVVVVHDLTFRVHPEWFRRDWRMRFDDIFWHKVRKASHILTVSEHSKSDIVRFLKVDPDRVTSTPEAADERFRVVEDRDAVNAARERYGMPPGFIFTVGSIHTRRNLERLIQSMAVAREITGSAPSLLIMGAKDASFSDPVEITGTAERCGLTENVRHVEYVTEEDLLHLYNACGLFAYPSLYEGFGLPVIEAMACGAPVVCSNVTSIPEVAGDAALYFNPEDTDEMGKAIARALTDTALRKRLSEAGRKRAATFSWRHTAEETLAVFNRILG